MKTLSRSIFLGGAVLFLLAVGGAGYIRSRTSLPPGLSAGPTAASQATFDHAGLDVLLSRRVHNAQVDYAGWKGSPDDLAALDAYLARLAAADIGRLGREERLAFFINAYNAITIRSILDAYPVASIRDIAGVWKIRTWRVAGGEVTLDQIEHRILRKEFAEPRIHFAIVCASTGCPPIQSWAFTGNRIDSQLQAVTVSFLNDPARTGIDAAKRRMTVTPILDWFGEDFIASSGSVPAFVLKYRPDLRDVSGKAWSVSFAGYDWSLNEARK